MISVLIRLGRRKKRTSINFILRWHTVYGRSLACIAAVLIFSICTRATVVLLVCGVSVLHDVHVMVSVHVLFSRLSALCLLSSCKLCQLQRDIMGGLWSKCNLMAPCNPTQTCSSAQSEPPPISLAECQKLESGLIKNKTIVVMVSSAASVHYSSIRCTTDSCCLEANSYDTYFSCVHTITQASFTGQ